MNWIFLLLAGLLEVFFTFCLEKSKHAAGSGLYFWYACFGVSLLLSMALLLRVIQTLPIGTVYVVWTGIGAVGTVLLGIFVFKEPAGFWRLFFLTTLIGSILGLKFGHS